MTSKPPRETPEQHTQQSVARQKAVKTTAAKLKRDTEAKASVLAVATEVLSNRVATLADAVQTNNYKIDGLAREVNRKPDDEEVRFITGMAAEERSKHFRYAVTTAVVSALLSGGVAYALAADRAEREHRDRMRVGYSACMASNERSIITAKVFEDVAVNMPPESPTKNTILQGAGSLRALVRDCEHLYPKEER